MEGERGGELRAQVHSQAEPPMGVRLGSRGPKCPHRGPWGNCKATIHQQMICKARLEELWFVLNRTSGCTFPL